MAALQNSCYDVFQENTGGGGLVIFIKVCLINIKRKRKNVNSILHKVPGIRHFILPKQIPSNLITETLSHQLILR